MHVRRRTPPGARPREFESFRSEIASAVEQHVAASAPETGGGWSDGGYRLDTFELGPSNQLVVRAVEAVLREPGRRYSPLFLYGPSGVGKTHLLAAIASEIARRTPAPAECITAAELREELAAARGAGSLPRWRARRRAAAALMVDDAHTVAGDGAFQEELVALLDAFRASGRQIVLAASRPPDALEGVSEALRTRLAGGLVARIGPPDAAVRARLFARHFSHLQPPPTPELLTYLSGRELPSARDVAGLANRLAVAAEFAGVPLSVHFVRQELDGAAARGAGAPPSVEATVDPYFLDQEKVAWDWPDLAGRVIEEPR